MTPLRWNRTASVVGLGLLAFLVSPSRAFAQAPDAMSPVTFVGPSGDPPAGGGNVGEFPITATITRVNLKLDGLEIEFTKRDGPDRWPDTAPCGDPGCVETRPDGTTIDMGALQYSLGLVLNIPGQGWYGSAPIETWYGNNVTGGQIQATGQIPDNWFYDANRWAPLTGYQPQPGETIGVFVVAGDARNNFYIVKERSNIVALPLPAPNVEASFCFDSAGQIIACPPPPPPPAAATGTTGTTGIPGIPGTFGVNPLLGNSTGGSTTTTTAPPPVPLQYTSGGNSLDTYSAISGGSGSSGGGGGGGGGGCFADSQAASVPSGYWMGIALILSALGVLRLRRERA